MSGINKNKKFTNKSFRQSLNHAIEGIIYAFKTQSNLRFHYIAGILILILSLFFDFSKVEFICLCITVGFVILAEMLNTVVESIVDLVTEEYREKAKIAKDVAAGGVLVAATISVVIAYFLYYDKLTKTTDMLLQSFITSPIHILFVILILVLLTVVVLKSEYHKTHKGTPLSGGMPSGHTALAFALSTYLWINTGNLMVAVVTFFLSFLIGQSRMEGKIHTLAEVLVGGALGTLIVIIVYQLFTFKFVLNL